MRRSVGAYGVPGKSADFWGVLARSIALQGVSRGPREVRDFVGRAETAVALMLTGSAVKAIRLSNARLALVALPLKVKHKAIEGLILRLLLESSLILHHFAWIFHAQAGSSCYCFELLLMCHLVLRVWGSTLATYGAAALAFACQAAHSHPLLFQSENLARCIIHGR